MLDGKVKNGVKIQDDIHAIDTLFKTYQQYNGGAVTARKMRLLMRISHLLLEIMGAREKPYIWQNESSDMFEKHINAFIDSRRDKLIEIYDHFFWPHESTHEKTD